MTAVKHTPGPWAADVKHKVVLQQSSKRIICVVDRVAAVGNRAHQNRSGADLVLIAAAPDLLTWLAWSLKLMAIEGKTDSWQYQQACAVLDKATGVTP